MNSEPVIGHVNSIIFTTTSVDKMVISWIKINWDLLSQGSGEGVVEKVRLG